MRDDYERSWQPFSVLVAAPADGAVRTLEQALEASGYAVIRAESGEEAVEVACVARPDAVLLGTHDADHPGVEVCRRLSGDPRFPATTPVILVADEAPGGREAAYRMGVWDVYAGPHDASALLLKLQTFMRARLVSERLRTESLIDGETGMYSYAGLTVRAQEVASAAARAGEPVSCVALLFSPGERAADGAERASGASGAFVADAASACRRLTRASDVLGRVGAMEFGLIAPGADVGGAAVLVTRLRQFFERYSWCTVRAAACSAPTLARETRSVTSLLAEARDALRQSMGGEPTPPPGLLSTRVAPWALRSL